MPAEVMRGVPLHASSMEWPALALKISSSGKALAAAGSCTRSYTRCIKAAPDSCIAKQGRRSLAAQAHGGLRAQLQCQAGKAVSSSSDLMSGAIV